MVQLVVLTLLAGLAIPAGATIAMVERIRPRWLETEFRHSVIAFGGGVLLSAVALVLVPDGAESLTWWIAIPLFVGGGFAFMLLDVLLARREGSASQLVAMLADFVPESIALGAMFAVDPGRGTLLALLIGLQNLPEGFNSYREVRASTSIPKRKLMIVMTGLALLGPICGIGGRTLLAEHKAIVGGIMLFAGGGILYLTFEDIAPQARLDSRYAPALGAVLGFASGLLGEMLIGA
ncbi:MAG: divalent cation transporter [Phycisphaerae bacterium]|nr:divalent cation transporter [Phycisphaerae bacterium]